VADLEFYLGHIAAYDREFKPWETRTSKIIARYRDDKRSRTDTASAKFNVLWSNVQTLKAATFARVPMPDVSRRFKDQDPIGRVAALILERALEFEAEHYRDFRASIGQCVYDRYLGGRGTAWVRYEPTFKQIDQGAQDSGAPLVANQPAMPGAMPPQMPGAMPGQMPQALGQPMPPMPQEAQEPETQVSEDAEAQSQAAEELDFECAPVDYVHWKDFGHSVARTWEEVTLVWRKVYMTRQALDERFGEKLAKTIPLDAIPDEQQRLKNSAESTQGMRALIFELWNKETGEAVWMHKTLGILDTKDDPLGLEEFFPCPPPIFSTLTTETLVPIPDFTLYQDQANELDVLADRIDGLVKALKVMGCYDASVPSIARLFTEAGNGDLIPVSDWAGFAEKQGLKGAIDIVDILPLAKALAEAYKAFDQIKGQIYELTGIADILRGETMASETATAQKIKNSYASLRLKVYQDEVEKFASRLLQLKAQIICNHFDDKTICQISACEQLSQADQQLVPQALQLLRNNVMRAFRVEVATDSMVYQDEQQEKQDRMEFLTAVAQFIEKASAAGQQSPQLIPLMMEMLKFGVTGFRIGKTLEGTIDQLADQLRQQAAQQAQNPQPHPDVAKAHAESQASLQQAQIKAQADGQAAQIKAQADMAISQAKSTADAQIEQQRMSHTAGLQQMAQQHKEQMAAMQAHQQQAMSAMESRLNANLQVMLEHIRAAAKIEAAEVTAGAALQTAQIAAANQAQGDGNAQ
jgi:hypothetical protein